MADRQPLNETEERVYAYVDRHGGAVLEEARKHFKWGSTRSVAYHLEHLEAKGWLRRLGRGWQRVEFLGPRPSLAPKPREIVPQVAREFSKPIDGYIAAGAPIPPSTPDGERLELGRLLGQIDVRLLQVRGDSMVEAAILHGDYVAVRPCAKADEGKIVVAELDGCHTLKVFRTFKGAPYLYPKNRTMDPIRLTARDDPRLVGVFVCLVRLVPPKV